METKNIAAASIIGVAAISFIGWQFVNNKDEKNNIKQDNSIPVANQNEQKISYKDGSYNAESSYTAPSGNETVKISINLKDNVISETNVEISNVYWGKIFSEGFKEQVVGKNIDEVNLTVVNGSSLTPIGFMDALSKVKELARN